MPTKDDNRFVKACQRMVGGKIDRVDYPGGESRDSCLLTLNDGRTFYATRRENVKLATLEARVMKGLHAKGGPVPGVLAFNGMLLIQEDVGHHRVSQALAEAVPDAADSLLRIGLDSLAQLHDAGTRAKLDSEVPAIGWDEYWLNGLLAEPAAISRSLAIESPVLDRDAMREKIRARASRLIKWDARPGNAILGSDGAVRWIDWEHCGRRNRLDDMIWFLADEATPDLPEQEDALLDDYVPRFADDLSFDAALSYLRVFGSLHMCVRLGLILEKKDGGDWWDPTYCLARDKAGVTPQGVRRLCDRGTRWSACDPLAQPLTDWFAKVRDRLLSAA